MAVHRLLAASPGAELLQCWAVSGADLAPAAPLPANYRVALRFASPAAARMEYAATAESPPREIHCVRATCTGNVTEVEALYRDQPPLPPLPDAKGTILSIGPCADDAAARAPQLQPSSPLRTPAAQPPTPLGGDFGLSTGRRPVPEMSPLEVALARLRGTPQSTPTTTPRPQEPPLPLRPPGPAVTVTPLSASALAARMMVESTIDISAESLTLSGPGDESVKSLPPAGLPSSHDTLPAADRSLQNMVVPGSHMTLTNSSSAGSQGDLSREGTAAQWYASNTQSAPQAEAGGIGAERERNTAMYTAADFVSLSPTGSPKSPIVSGRQRGSGTVVRNTPTSQNAKQQYIDYIRSSFCTHDMLEKGRVSFGGFAGDALPGEEDARGRPQTLEVMSPTRSCLKQSPRASAQSSPRVVEAVPVLMEVSGRSDDDGTSSPHSNRFVEVMITKARGRNSRLKSLQSRRGRMSMSASEVSSPRGAGHIPEIVVGKVHARNFDPNDTSLGNFSLLSSHMSSSRLSSTSSRQPLEEGSPRGASRRTGLGSLRAQTPPPNSQDTCAADHDLPPTPSRRKSVPPNLQRTASHASAVSKNGSDGLRDSSGDLFGNFGAVSPNAGFPSRQTTLETSMLELGSGERTPRGRRVTSWTVASGPGSETPVNVGDVSDGYGLGALTDMDGSIPFKHAAQGRGQLGRLGEEIMKKDEVLSSADSDSDRSASDSPSQLSGGLPPTPPPLSPGRKKRLGATVTTSFLQGCTSDGLFQPAHILPKYGEKTCRLDELKYGDCIVLMTSRGADGDGLLSVCWTGDQCFPVTQHNFGGGRIPKFFENTVYRIEQTLADRAGPNDKGDAQSKRGWVCFGQSIQLYNVVTGKYLCVRNSDDFFDPKYTLSLHTDDDKGYCNTALHFKFVPSTLMRSDGERVRLGDTVQVVSVRSAAYVAARAYRPVPGPGNGADLVSLQNMDSFREETEWTLNGYHVSAKVDAMPDTAAAGPANESQHAGVPTGVAVLIYHKELEAFLTASGTFQSALRPAKTGSLGPLAAEDRWTTSNSSMNERYTVYYDTSSIPESTSTFVISDFPHSSNALWLVEELDPTKGRPIKWLQQRQAYRIRHVASGGYLTPTRTGTAKPLLGISASADNPETILVFHPVNTVEGTPEDAGMLISSMCRLQFVQSGLWLHFSAESTGAGLGRDSSINELPSGKRGRVRPMLAKNAVYNGVFALRPTETSEMEQLQCVISLKKTLMASLNAFIHYAPPTASAASHQPQEGDGRPGLQSKPSFASPLQTKASFASGAGSQASARSRNSLVAQPPQEAPGAPRTPLPASLSDAIHNAWQALTALILFCASVTDRGIEKTAWDPFSYTGAVIRERQSLLFSQSVHLLCLKLLQVPFQANHTIERRFVDVFRLAYHLLKEMVRDSPDLAKHLAPYIPFIESHLPKNFRAKQALVEIYNGNEALLSKLTQAQIEGYMLPYPHFELISCICVCEKNGERVGIRRNQKIVLEALGGIASNIIIRTRAHHGVVWVKPSTEMLQKEVQDEDDFVRTSSGQEIRAELMSMRPGVSMFAGQRSEGRPLSRQTSSTLESTPSNLSHFQQRHCRESTRLRATPVTEDIPPEPDLMNIQLPDDVADDDEDPFSEDESSQQATPLLRAASSLMSRGTSKYTLAQFFPPEENTSRDRRRRRAGWIPLKEFIEGDSFARSGQVKHFEGMLLLWSVLCIDADRDTIDRVKRAITFEQVLLGILMDYKNPLCDSIRTAYAQITRYLYARTFQETLLASVGLSSNLDLRSTLMRNDTERLAASISAGLTGLGGWRRHDSGHRADIDEMGETTRTLSEASTSEKTIDDEDFVLLKWVCRYHLLRNTVLVTECVPRNTFTMQLLRLMQELLRQGAYSPSEVEKTLPCLLHLLDPSTDAVDMLNAKKAPYLVEDASPAHDAPWGHAVPGVRRGRRDRRRSGPSRNFGRKSRRATMNNARDSVFHYCESLSVVLDAKVEACRTIMMMMDKDGEGGYDFQSWLSKIKIGNRVGGDLLAHILLQNTLYEGGASLYAIALETLYRSFSETLGNGRRGKRYTDVGNIDNTSITAMAKLLLSYMLKPKTSRHTNPDMLMQSLLLHLKRSVPNGDSLCAAILRTCTKMIRLVDEKEMRMPDGAVVTQKMMQEMLNSLGLTADIAMLIDSNNEHVIKCGLDCGIALLEGGNVTIQESLLKFFLSRDDEVFFKSLFDRIEAAVFALRSAEGNSLGGLKNSRSFKFGDPFGDTGSAGLASLGSTLNLRRRGGASRAADDASDDEEDYEQHQARALLYSKEVMRYLQLFCEGHYTPLQNYMRDQGDNVNTYNLVAESLNFLEAVLQAGLLDEYKGEVALQTFQTLTEYCQGPVVESQSCLIRGGVCICVNAVFIENTSGEERTGVDMKELCERRPDLVDAVRVAAVETVLSLLEGVVERSNAAVMIGNQGLDLELFRETLLDCWRDGKHGAHTELGFSIFILFRTLQGYFAEGGGELSHLTTPCAEDERECMAYFGERMGRIEICRGGELERVYFRIPEICVSSGLGEKTKTELLWGVRRNTAAEKIIDFFDKGDLLIHDVEYTNTWFLTSHDLSFRALAKTLFEKDKFALAIRSLCRRYEDTMEKACVWIAVVTNVVIVQCDMNGTHAEGLAGQVIALLALMQVLAMCVLIGAFIYTDAPIVAYKRYKEHIAELRVKTEGEAGKGFARRVEFAERPTGTPRNRPLGAPPVLSGSDDAGSPRAADGDGNFSPRRRASETPDGGWYLPDEALGLGDVATLGELFETFKELEGEEREERSDTRSETRTTSDMSSPTSSAAPNSPSRRAALASGASTAPTTFLSLSLILGLKARIASAGEAARRTVTTGAAVAGALVARPPDPTAHHNLAVARTCLTTATFYQHIVMLWIGIYGLLVNPLVMALHLFLMIRASPVLLNVIRAITQNGKALLLTSVLGIVVIYLFSVVAYVQFHDAFHSAGDGGKVCQELWSCFVFNLAYGIRSGGGIGDHMTDPPVGAANYGEQMLFELLFFVMVIVILLNIIFGIIIDTFAELRAQRHSVEEDIHTKCFICGIEASEFDRHADGFQHHIKQDHNMWLYIFFLHHLRLKDAADFTGQESFVSQQVDAADLSFFPMNKALALDKTEKTRHEEEASNDKRDSRDVLRTLVDLDAKIFEGLNINASGLQEVRNHFGEVTRTVKDLSTSVDRLKASIEEEVPAEESHLLRSGVSFLYR
eukprot:TRINITY_DN2003_c2_g3_i1.p1 TRINITY_DN2003_c2_g3~~TRINITY_DN2003_c2_g3_i1.p1  ORF type:complete len:3278 (+),score=1090.44 TRINITY_DN2003_c2_g3_i1:148-9834(+)